MSQLPAILDVSPRLSIPRLGPAVIARPRLVDRICGPPRPPVALIRAPAGWGKTILAGQIAQRLVAEGDHVAWVTVEGDDDAHTITANLLAALRLARPDLGPALDAIRLPPATADLPAVLDHLLAAAHSVTGGLTVVLDDVHLVTDEGALDCLKRFLSHLPDNVRALLIGRNDPALPLNRWRMTGLLAEVLIGDLAATRPETEQLLTLLGLRLTAPEIDQLVGATEGWIGGIRLAGRAIAAAPTRAAAFERILRSGGAGGLPDYLIEQVIGQLPEPTQRFLRDVSVVNPLPVELAVRLTGREDAVALLRDVAAGTGFVVAIDSAERTFRSHQMMSAALRYQLAADPERRRRLHHAAARWFLEQEWTVPAIRQALLAREWTMAKELLINGFSRLTVEGRVSTIRSLLGQMPPALILGDPALAATELGARVWMGDFTRMDELAAIMDSGVDDLEATDPARARWVRFVRAMTAMGRGRVIGDYPDLERVLDQLESTNLVDPAGTPGAAQWHAVIASNRGTAALWSGEMARAQGLLNTAVDSVRTIGYSLPALNCQAQLSWIDLLDGRLAAAYDRATAAVGQAERCAWTTVYQVAPAYACLSAIALERGDLATARQESGRAQRASRPWNEHAIGVVIGQTDARINTAANRPEEGLATLSALRLNPATRPTTSLLDGIVAFAEAEAAAAAGRFDLADERLAAARADPAVTALFRARERLALGDPHAAVDILVDPATQLALGRLRWAHIRRLLWLARAHQLTAARHRAIAGLRTALDLAHQDGYRTPFAELGPHARPLLTVARPAEFGARAGLVGELLADLPARPPPTPAETGFHPEDVGLTARERELLVLLPTRMTNDDIARMLEVSVNTVKTHARSIYRKLGVPNRRSAVARAERIGLL